MKIAVYGSGGFVGTRLCARLREAGHEIFGSDPRQGAEEMADPPAGLDSVVFLAQSHNYRNVPAMAWHVFQTNEVLALRVATKAAEGGAKRFVYASTGSVYAPSFAPLSEDGPLRRDDYYALSKVHAEEALALLRDRIEVVLVRPFGIYGPGQQGMLVANLLASIREGKPITLEPNPRDPADGRGRRMSLCYVDDSAAIFARLAECGGPPIVNLAGEEAVSIAELSTKLGELAGKSPQFVAGSRARTGDLIADLTLLRKSVSPRFTPLAAGLERTVNAAMGKPV